MQEILENEDFAAKLIFREEAIDIMFNSRKQKIRKKLWPVNVTWVILSEIPSDTWSDASRPQLFLHRDSPSHLSCVFLTGAEVTRNPPPVLNH
ncbi:hypothetical protein TNCV_731421 [Trichonephila clavipes]|nr:hypothetical protein TNCV_731421 [Trichonephila clavipes]